MAEQPIDPQSPAEGESAARADSLAARAGRAVRRLDERLRLLGELAGAGLGPTLQTVRRDLGDAFGHLRRARHLGIIVAGAVLVLYVLSGTYVVSPGEVAVVTRFGKAVQARVTPGLRWRLPWPVDALLTSGRAAFQQQARDRAQQTLDAYRSGLELVSIDFQEIAPPGDVVPAFRDVASAREEKNKLINDAQGYANSVIPQARGEAQKRLREAEGYKTDVVNRARGEAQRFADVVAQYRRDAQTFGPEVTRYRLYVETMERILPKARKYIVEPGQHGEQINLRLLEPLPAAPQSPSGRP